MQFSEVLLSWTMTFNNKNKRRCHRGRVHRNIAI